MTLSPTGVVGGNRRLRIVDGNADDLRYHFYIFVHSNDLADLGGYVELALLLPGLGSWGI